MSLFELYLLVILPNLKPLFGTIAFVGFIAMSILLAISYIEEKPILRQFTKSLLFGSIFSGLIASVIPTENQMYLIAGGYVITNNAEMAKLPTNVLGAANAWMGRIKDAAEPVPKPDKGV